MNTVVLQKCLAELNKEEPNIDKVIGMIETMVEMGGSINVPIPQYNTPPQAMMTPNIIHNVDIAPDSSGLIESLYGENPTKIGRI